MIQTLLNVSKMANFSSQTSTGNLNVHLPVTTKHGIKILPDDKAAKIVDYLHRSYSADDSDLSLSSVRVEPHEFNRHLALWFCRDLLPFSLVSSNGFGDFCAKYLPGLKLPSEATLSIAALNDLYVGACSTIKELLKDARSVCVMVDAWTDKYKARPYVAVRVSFVKKWKFYIVTLDCQIVPKYTGEALADYIVLVLKRFFPDIKKLFITICLDGTANVVKASRILKSEHFQHCVAHCIHLLCTDSLHKVTELSDLLQKCRNVVMTLHFKSSVIEDQLTASADKKFVEHMSQLNEELESMVTFKGQSTLKQ